jgi:hypothetical protein
MGAGRSLNVLMLAMFDGKNANVIRDYLFSFNAYSRHRFYYLFNCQGLDETFDFSRFDVITFFWSMYLLGPHLTPATRQAIRTAAALKVLFLQDEYREVWPMNAAMRELGIQVMFTCVAERDHASFYPPSAIPSLLGTHTVLPGYVPGYLERARPTVEFPRVIDVAYRSRDVPFYLGDLGREKRIISDRFEVICAQHALRADISVREQDRIYGEGWVRFLQSSRCVLGTASGASVVDFTGEIRENCEHHLRQHPEAPYEEVRARFFADVDGKLVIDTVSPRVFEAAALRCTMVHHEGSYAGIMEPDRHYIRVKRDYSNVADVVAQIRDEGLCRAIADHAYRDLVASGRYGYRAFVAEFDRLLARYCPRPVRARTASRLLFHAKNYVCRGEVIVPRGAGFRVAPWYFSPFRVVWRALQTRPAVELNLHPVLNPVVARFMRNPGNFLRRARTALQLASSVPCFRTLVRTYLRTSRARRAVAAWRLTDDLLKIDIARRARGGILHAEQAFGVQTDFDATAGVLTLLSFGTAPGAAPAPLAAEVEDAVLEGRVHTIVWDHTPVAHDVVYAIEPGQWFRVGLGLDGVHRFEALSALYRLARAETAPALLAILRGESGREGAPASASGR